MSDEFVTFEESTTKAGIKAASTAVRDALDTALGSSWHSVFDRRRVCATASIKMPSNRRWQSRPTWGAGTGAPFGRNGRSPQC
jgi:hypothetical protein